MMNNIEFEVGYYLEVETEDRVLEYDLETHSAVEVLEEQSYRLNAINDKMESE